MTSISLPYNRYNFKISNTTFPWLRLAQGLFGSGGVSFSHVVLEDTEIRPGNKLRNGLKKLLHYFQSQVGLTSTSKTNHNTSSDKRYEVNPVGCYRVKEYFKTTGVYAQLLASNNIDLIKAGNPNSVQNLGLAHANLQDQSTKNYFIQRG